MFISPVQDSYQQPIARMLEFFISAYQENPGATLEVFAHKAESLAEDYKIGTWSRDPLSMFPCGRRVTHARLSDVLLNEQSAFSFRPETHPLLRKFSTHTATSYRRIARLRARIRADARQLPPYLRL
jgi:hypothetical protein